MILHRFLAENCTNASSTLNLGANRTTSEHIVVVIIFGHNHNFVVDVVEVAFVEFFQRKNIHRKHTLLPTTHPPVVQWDRIKLSSFAFCLVFTKSIEDIYFCVIWSVIKGKCELVMQIVLRLANNVLGHDTYTCFYTATQRIHNWFHKTLTHNFEYTNNRFCSTISCLLTNCEGVCKCFRNINWQLAAAFVVASPLISYCFELELIADFMIR